ncbi:MAG: hypothetical protein WKF75_06980 [Singulisphaera sp.]
MAKGTDVEKYQVLASLAPIDPSRVLELIERRGPASPSTSWTASAAPSPPAWPGRARRRR